MKKFYLLLCLFVFAQMTPFILTAQPPTDLVVLDDFSDGNFTADPEWTVVEGSGRWEIKNLTTPTRPNVVETNMSSTLNPNGFSALSTPFTKACNAWQIDITTDFSCTSPGRKVEYYFLMTSASNDPRKASGYKLSYHLQVLQGTTRRNILYLEKVENGVASTTPIITFNNGTSCSIGKITLDYNDGNWKLFIGNTMRGTGTDNSYQPSESAYQAIAVVDSVTRTQSDRYRFDNIKYREASITSIRKESDKLLNMSLKAYPNPATDYLQINVESKKAEQAEIRLLDIQGRMLYSKAISVNAGVNQYDLNLKQWGIQSGTYILKLQAGTKEQHLKVMVQ